LVFVGEGCLGGVSGLVFGEGCLGGVSGLVFGEGCQTWFLVFC